MSNKIENYNKYARSLDSVFQNAIKQSTAVTFLFNVVGMSIETLFDM